MSYSRKLPTDPADRRAEVLAGRDVAKASVPGKSDFSDWIEMMEVVEALCPVWPAREAKEGDIYKL